MMKLLMASALVLASFGTASAQFDAPTNCEKFRGEWICEDPVGNSENSDGNSQTVATTSRGNLTKKKECSGPGNGGSDAQC
jgi:hypothetical protein